jgi:hypothetical protein
VCPERLPTKDSAGIVVPEVRWNLPMIKTQARPFPTEIF